MEENKEIWRPIKGFEGLYEVSNLGNIKNKNGKRMKYQIRKGYKNYCQAIITFLHNTLLLSRIVAQAFPEVCGEWFDSCDVHHIDRNPLNNNALNLIVCTREEHHKFHSGSNNPLFGKHRSNEIKEKISKGLKGKNAIAVYQLDTDGNIIQKWESAVEASKQLGICNGHISACCRGKRLTTGGYRWSYANPEDNHS